MSAFAVTNVLAPVDLGAQSLPALRYARLFADRFSAKLEVLYSDPIAYPTDYVGPMQAYYVNASPEHQASLREEVEKNVAPVLAGQPYAIVVTVGQAVPAILAAAKDDTDLIVMGSHLRHGWRRTLLGSVSEGVLHGSVCPVLVVANGEASITKIVCPVNFTDVARESALAAAHLARAFGARLTLVRVIEPDAVTSTTEDEEKIRRWIDPELQKICSYVEVVERGGAAERVLDCAEDFGADLLVLGAQRRAFRDTTVIGSTAERLIRFAPCPVFVVPREAESRRERKEAGELATLAG